MKNLLQNRARLFYLHKNAVPQEEGVFDLILSPQFYWVKKVSLPVKRVSAAKKLAESVFEGSLPEGNYSYDVTVAEDGEFILIAYDKAEIADAIERFFIKNAKVQGAWFAQHACSDLDECCTVDEDSSLVNLNGLLVQIPRNCTEPKLTIDKYLETLHPKGKKIRFGTLDAEVIDQKTFVYLAAASLLFLGAFGIEYFDYRRALSQLEANKAALVRKYDLPPTTIQLESIKHRLEKTFRTQKKLRDALYALSTLPLEKGSFIRRLDLEPKNAQIEIMLKDTGAADKLKSYLRQKFKILDSSLEDKILHIKIAV